MASGTIFPLESEFQDESGPTTQSSLDGVKGWRARPSARLEQSGWPVGIISVEWKPNTVHIDTAPSERPDAKGKLADLYAPSG